MPRKGAAAALFFTLCVWSSAARADPPWVWRDLVTPRGEVAFDVGGGLAHIPDPQGGTGFGFNLELKAGIAPHLELGIRTGIRADIIGQAARADNYARPFDTETFGTNADAVANPELHLKWAVARGPAAELGLELAAYLPIENNSRFGFMFALPLALHANSIRVDSGLYVPIIFTDPHTDWTLSIPIQLWIQATRTFWLGPVFAMNFVHLYGVEYNQFPFGFGLGNTIAPNVDLRAWFLFPDINADQAARTFGAGLAFEFRFG
ncbi:MAG TPA: hypothetical protein VMT03_14455 [Polyangia bacterium]|nr:hypothetical protein [Polyangia bacterium]